MTGYRFDMDVSSRSAAPLGRYSAEKASSTLPGMPSSTPLLT